MTKKKATHATDVIDLNNQREKKARVDADRVAELQKANEETEAQADERDMERIRGHMHFYMAQKFTPKTVGAAVDCLETWVKQHPCLPDPSEAQTGQAGLDVIILNVMEGLRTLAEIESAGISLAASHIRTAVMDALERTEHAAN